MSNEEDKGRNPNDYLNTIAAAFEGVQTTNTYRTDGIAEPLLRIFHSIDIINEHQQGALDEILECATQIRRLLYWGDARIAEELRRAEAACGECAGDIHTLWGEAEFAVHKLREEIAGLQQSLAREKSRVEWLEAQKDLRVQEHSPASPDLRAKVLSLTSGKCAYCDAEITSDSSDGNANFVIEHVVPKSCGGPDHFANYVPACSKCNAQKSAGHVLEFIQRRLVSARVEIAEAAE